MPVASALPAISSLLGAGGGLASSLGLGNNAAEWRQNAGVGAWNQNNQGLSDALTNMYYPYADSVRNNLASNTDQWGQVAYPWGDATFQRAENQLMGVPQTFKDSAMSYTPDDIQNWFKNQQAQYANNLSNGVNKAFGVFDNNGQIGRSIDGFSAIDPMFRGQDQTQQGMKQSALDILQNGGYTGGTDALFGAGQNALNGNPYITGSQQLGMDIASKNPLMTPEQASNYAGELAGRGIRQQGEKVYRDANNRGGGPGAVIASGTGNQMKADFADDASRSMTDARMQALMAQQGLGLQQQGMGMNLLGQGNSASNQLYGTGVGAMQAGENAATSRLGVGGNLASSALTNQLGYGNLYNGMMGNEMNYGLGAGGLMNSMSGTQGQLANNGFQNGLSNAGMNLGYISQGNNLGNMISGQQNNAMGNMTGAYSANMNPYMQGNNLLAGMSQNGLNFAGQYLNNVPSILNNMTGAGNQQSDTPWGSLASGVGGVLGAGAGLFKPGGGGN